MFTVSDTVTNAGTRRVSLSNYGRVTRFDKPTTRQRSTCCMRA